ncbi:MAG: metallophosphoesterase [Candidatus Micrarchaeota archaeon]
MKLAFIADTHFGYPKYEEDARIQGTAAILDACKKADVILLGGDIFDRRIPKLETLAYVANLLRKADSLLPKSPYPKIYGIHGTHEMRPKGVLNPIAMMAELGLMEDVHNKTLVLEKGTSVLQTEKVGISGLGGIPDDLVKDVLSRISCKPEEDATNFFLFHQTLHEFVPQAKNLAKIEDLPKGYDYYLCGHLHAKKDFLSGKLLIPGSTVITQHKDDEQSEKGYYLIDTMNENVEFVPIKTRPFSISEIKFENAKPADARIMIEKEISSLMEKEWDDKPILKIKLTGSLAKGSGELDLNGFENAKAFIIIDNQLEGNSLIAELQKLKQERAMKSTPLELGMSLLRENAKNAGLDEKIAEKYFEQFAQAN